MDIATVVVVCALCIFLGATVGVLAVLTMAQYYKAKYEAIAADVDKKVSEVIHMMDVEQFKIEKELVEREYKND